MNISLKELIFILKETYNDVCTITGKIILQHIEFYKNTSHNVCIKLNDFLLGKC